MSAPQKAAPRWHGADADQTQNEHRDSAAPAAARKEQADIAARLARLGYSLHELACGGYLIARWDRTAHCADLRQAREFLQRVGGAR